MAAGREVRAGKAFVELSLRNKLQAGLRKAAGQLRAFSRVTATMGAALTAASTSILGPLSAAVLQFSSLGDTVHKMAARTGMSAEAVSELGHAANLSGTDLKTLETGVRRMQQTAADAASGITFAQDSLARFSLTAADLAARLRKSNWRSLPIAWRKSAIRLNGLRRPWKYSDARERC